MAKRIISEATYLELFGDFKTSCDSGLPNKCSTKEEFLKEIESYDEALYFFKDMLNDALAKGDKSEAEQLKRDVQRSKNDKVRFIEANRIFLKEAAAV